MGESKPTVRHERAACPLYTAIGVIEGRWKPMLFQRLARRPSGFGELHRAMSGISRKVLAEQLRQMECDDLVVRRETGDRLGSVEYALTPYGETWGRCSRSCGSGALSTSPAPVSSEAP